MTLVSLQPVYGIVRDRETFVYRTFILMPNVSGHDHNYYKKWQVYFEGQFIIRRQKLMLLFV